MGEEQKMQLFIGSTPIDAVPLNAQELLIGGFDAEEDSVSLIPEPMSWSLTMDAPLFKQEELKKLFRKPKFSRKLKKAVGQMWDIDREDNECEVSVSVKRKTKWQRKAARMVRCIEGDMCLPMKNGMMFIINLNKD